MYRPIRMGALPAENRTRLYTSLRPHALGVPASDAPALPRYGADGRGLKVGLMGGSFNPAHEGHLHVARMALAWLGLDEVWWLVSPQNPLKVRDGMAPFPSRFAAAESLASRHPRVRARDIELYMGTHFTADTVVELRRRCPGTRFVWIMGADNLAQFHRWERWSRILHAVPVAVFDRPSYSLKALSSRAALRFSRHRVPFSQSRCLAYRSPPAWVFLHTPLNALSATRIRASLPDA